MYRERHICDAGREGARFFTFPPAGSTNKRVGKVTRLSYPIYLFSLQRTCCGRRREEEWEEERTEKWFHTVRVVYPFRTVGAACDMCTFLDRHGAGPAGSSHF